MMSNSFRLCLPWTLISVLLQHYLEGKRDNASTELLLTYSKILLNIKCNMIAVSTNVTKKKWSPICYVPQNQTPRIRGAN